MLISCLSARAPTPLRPEANRALINTGDPLSPMPIYRVCTPFKAKDAECAEKEFVTGPGVSFRSSPRARALRLCFKL